MDTLSLRKYHRKGTLVNSEITSPKKLATSKKIPAGNTTHMGKGRVKQERTFLEFYINDQPLTELLDKFYNIEGTIIDNWTGVLGSFGNQKAELIKVKQLLGKSISDREIKQLYPAEWSDEELQWYLEKTREELDDPEVIIYCCAECGDYDCGGIAVEIKRTDNTFTWTFTDENNKLTFEFDMYQYYELFDKYTRQIEK